MIHKSTFVLGASCQVAGLEKQKPARVHTISDSRVHILYPNPPKKHSLIHSHSQFSPTPLRPPRAEGHACFRSWAISHFAFHKSWRRPIAAYQSRQPFACTSHFPFRDLTRAVLNPLSGTHRVPSCIHDFVAVFPREHGAARFSDPFRSNTCAPS